MRSAAPLHHHHRAAGGALRAKMQQHIVAVGRRAAPAPATAASPQPQKQRNTTAAMGKRGDVLLVAEGVSKTHDGERMLFTNLSFTVSAGDRIAVVGPNGAGKSTLLKVIAGRDAHSGGVVTRNKGARVGFLSQSDDLAGASDGDSDGEGGGGGGASSSGKAGGKKQRGGSSSSSNGSSAAGGMTVLEAVLASDNDVTRAVRDYERALAAASGGRVTAELQRAMERMDALNGWEVDGEARRLLAAVGLPGAAAPAAGLSGGQRRRLALAAALLGGPDLLVLDEPTNHMDVGMISWMSSELSDNADRAVVTVTHDRAFMEAACNRVLELDGAGGAYLHNIGGPGSYAKFKEARAARRAAQAGAAADARTVLRRESEWMARQPKARSTKSRSRIAAFYDLTAKAKDVPPPEQRVDFGAGQMARQGGKAIVMRGVSYSLPNNGRALVDDFTFEFMPGERLGVAGPNGAGKSTLLDLVAGALAPDKGAREVGATAVVGYFTQHPPPVDPDLRLIDYIRTFADAPRPGGAAGPGAAAAAAAAAAADPEGLTRTGGGGSSGGGSWGGGLPNESPEVLLERLGFERRRQFQKAASLSGGERRRLHLAAVLAARPNVLILDEPTNDLSLEVVEALEGMLSEYRGVLITVSHDRAFMDGAADRLLVLRGDGVVRLFDGSYTEYLDLAAAEAAAAAAEAAAAAVGNGSSSGSSNGVGHSSSSSTSSSNGAGSQAAAATATAAAPAKSGGKGSKQQQPQPSKGATATAAAPAKKKRALGIFERQELEKIDAELADLGARRDALNARLVELASAGNAARGDVERASVELAEVDAREQALSERWLELSEIAGDL